MLPQVKRYYSAARLIEQQRAVTVLVDELLGFPRVPVAEVLPDNKVECRAVQNRASHHAQRHHPKDAVLHIARGSYVVIDPVVVLQEDFAKGTQDAVALCRLQDVLGIRPALHVDGADDEPVHDFVVPAGGVKIRAVLVRERPFVPAEWDFDLGLLL